MKLQFEHCDVDKIGEKFLEGSVFIPVQKQ